MVTHRIASLVFFALAGCGGSSIDYVEQVPTAGSGYPAGFYCGANDQTPVTVADKKALGCLGLVCDPTAYEPGSTQCADKSLNPFAGSCIESFFSVFAAGGTCTSDMQTGSVTWQDGARRIQLGRDGKLFAPGASEPCIITLNGGSTIAFVRQR